MSRRPALRFATTNERCTDAPGSTDTTADARADRRDAQLADRDLLRRGHDARAAWRGAGAAGDTTDAVAASTPIRITGSAATRSPHDRPVSGRAPAGAGGATTAPATQASATRRYPPREAKLPRAGSPWPVRARPAPTRAARRSSRLFSAPAMRDRPVPRGDAAVVVEPDADVVVAGHDRARPRHAIRDRGVRHEGADREREVRVGVVDGDHAACRARTRCRCSSMPTLRRSPYGAATGVTPVTWRSGAAGPGTTTSTAMMRSPCSVIPNVA